MKLMGGRRTFPLPPPRPVMLVAAGCLDGGSYGVVRGALWRRNKEYCSTGVQR